MSMNVREPRMIDPKKETLLPLRKASRLFLTRPTYRTLWRWKAVGYRGVKLETMRQGKALVTSVEAVYRFMEATNKPKA